MEIYVAIVRGLAFVIRAEDHQDGLEHAVEAAAMYGMDVSEGDVRLTFCSRDGDTATLGAFRADG